MVGLREFKAIDPARHNPAVGSLYGKGTLGRLLIVGMSHYGEESYVKWAEFTHAVVTEVVTGERRIPYFTKITRLFLDPEGRPYSPRDFFPLVAFYTFLPDVFKFRQSVAKEQWLNPEAQRFFFRVVDS